jgi:Domain of unknown function (DUF4335)
MESNHLNTRTYTAPTCELIIATKNKQLSRLDVPSERFRQQPQQLNNFDFTLHLDHPDRGELERIVLQGQPQQLDRLQKIVSQYIAELVAKFPVPVANHSNTNVASVPDPVAPSELNLPDDEPSISNQLYPNTENETLKSGLMKNLPGLRNNPPLGTPASNLEPQPNPTKSPISKLFGFWNKSHDRQNSGIDRADMNIPSPLMGLEPSKSASENLPTTPYLTGGDRSLDHQLHLGDLATPTSGATINLSAIQLFDLAIVLDEFALEQPTSNPTRSTPLNPKASARAEDRSTSADLTATSLSRLPNLPKIPAAPEATQVYYKTRRSRSSFMSAIPWAAAAAVAISAPLLLDPNSNLLKDAASKVKIPGLNPNLAGSKKSATSPLAGTQPVNGDRSTIANAPKPNLPKPWQEQPVQPPQASPKPADVGVQTPQTTNKIGIAPLPESIVGKPGQQPPATAGKLGSDAKPGVVSSILPRSGVQSGIAPNPLSTSQLPDISNIGNPGTKPSPIEASKPRPTTATAPVAVGKTTKPSGGQLPIDSGAILSVSKQPMTIPPELTTSNSPIPFNPPDMGGSGADGAIERSQSPKKVANSTTVASKTKPKTVKSTSRITSPQPGFEPFTPVPRNPNLIDPKDIPTNGNNGAVEPQNPPVVPDKPLQSSNGSANAEAANPSLQEAKRYFQGKWKADTNQTNSLQYVIQVNGKSGVVRSVSPQGEAATTYLQQTKLIKAGQKLISPAPAAGDQKIRVLLEPDGNVDTFIEP